MLAIIGAGGYGLEIVDGLVSGQYLDENLEPLDSKLLWIDNVPGLASFTATSAKLDVQIGDTFDHLNGEYFCIGVADPIVRHGLYSKCIALGLMPKTLVHKTAVISGCASFGKGCVIGPYSYLGPKSRTHDNVVLNIYSSVGHHATLGHSAVLSPYATLNGNAWVGDCSFLGTHSAVSVGSRMGRYSKLATGSVLNSDAEDGSLCVGNPAKSRVMFAVEN